MKSLKISAALFIASFAFLLAGCSTVGDHKVTVQDFAPGIKAAAFGGTYYALKEHPEWRPGFETAADELKTIYTSDKIDFATIMTIVQRLPVKELQSDNAKLAITAGTILLSGYGNQIIELDRLENIKPVAQAIEEGIRLGLQ